MLIVAGSTVYKIVAGNSMGTDSSSISVAGGSAVWFFSVVLVVCVWVVYS